MSSRSDAGCRRPSDCGSSFVEALLALSLIAVVCAAAAPCARSIAVALERAHRLVELDRSLLRTDDLVRREVGRIRFPPRAAALNVERLPAGIKIAFLDGDPHRCLDLRYRNGLLVVDDGVAFKQIAGFSAVDFLFLYDGIDPNRRSPVPVVCARLESAGGERVSLFVNVGGWPLLPARLEIQGER